MSIITHVVNICKIHNLLSMVRVLVVGGNVSVRMHMQYPCLDWCESQKIQWVAIFNSPLEFKLDTYTFTFITYNLTHNESAKTCITCDNLIFFSDVIKL